MCEYAPLESKRLPIQQLAPKDALALKDALAPKDVDIKRTNVNAAEDIFNAAKQASYVQDSTHDSCLVEGVDLIDTAWVLWRGYLSNLKIWEGYCKPTFEWRQFIDPSPNLFLWEAMFPGNFVGKAGADAAPDVVMSFLNLFPRLYSSEVMYGTLELVSGQFRWKSRCGRRTRCCYVIFELVSAAV